MLIKLLGGILAIASGSVIGLYYSSRTGFRISALTELKNAMLALKSEIGYSLASLPEAMGHVAEKQGDLSRFFETVKHGLSDMTSSVRGVWESSIESALSNSYLEQEDKDALSGLGQTLGYIDKELQIRSIDMLIDYIDAKISELAPQKLRDKKLYLTLGTMAGLLVTIVLF